jgi:O-antigen/teichoic acid export membrane protein
MSPVRSILGVAALITALTALSRLTGFARNLVLARTVGFNCLSDAYTTINTVPNILYEVVAGGALASLVVPLLAAAVDRGDRDTVNRTASALLTWTVVVLVPLMLLVLALGGPIAVALLGDKGCGGSSPWPPTCCGSSPRRSCCMASGWCWWACCRRTTGSSARRSRRSSAASW